jgi:hypothetical protein
MARPLCYKDWYVRDYGPSHTGVQDPTTYTEFAFYSRNIPETVVSVGYVGDKRATPGTIQMRYREDGPAVLLLGTYSLGDYKFLLPPEEYYLSLNKLLRARK